MVIVPLFVFLVRAIILVMVFVDKIKKVIIRTFLGTESNKYITTEAGLKLQLSDPLGYIDRTKFSGTWSDKTKSS